MDSIFLELFNKLDSDIDLGMSKDIQAFLESKEEVKDYNLKADENNMVIVNIILNNFSISFAEKKFMDFVNFVGYNDINLFIRNDMFDKVEYLYFTSIKNSTGMKMKITIE